MTSREWQQLNPEIRGIIENAQQSLPVNLPRLARELGVPIKSSTLAPGISGEIRPSPEGGFIIRINRHDPAKRQRFTVAHELSHFLLHRDEIGEGIEDDVLYRSELSDRREQQANRLAADILMPEDHLREEVDTATEKGVGDIILYLSERFMVSEAAMKIKAEKIIP